MVVFASEDIGLAQPTALVVANAVLQAVDTIGMPECGKIWRMEWFIWALAKKIEELMMRNLLAMEDAENMAICRSQQHRAMPRTKINERFWLC